MTDNLTRLPRIIVRAAVDVVADFVAAFYPTPVGKSDTWPCGGVDECYCGTEDRNDFAQPVGEVPDLPPCVPAPAWATAPAPVPGGGSPAAAGDHSPTSALLDAAAHRLASMASGRVCHSDALDDLITELHERAEQFRAIEAMPMPLGYLTGQPT